MKNYPENRNSKRGIPLSEFPDGRMQLAITPLDADEGYFTPSDEEIDQMLKKNKLTNKKRFEWKKLKQKIITKNYVIKIF